MNFTSQVIFYNLWLAKKTYFSLGFLFVAVAAINISFTIHLFIVSFLATELLFLALLPKQKSVFSSHPWSQELLCDTSLRFGGSLLKMTCLYSFQSESQMWWLELQQPLCFENDLRMKAMHSGGETESRLQVTLSSHHSSTALPILWILFFSWKKHRIPFSFMLLFWGVLWCAVEPSPEEYSSYRFVFSIRIFFSPQIYSVSEFRSLQNLNRNSDSQGYHALRMCLFLSFW